MLAVTCLLSRVIITMATMVPNIRLSPTEEEEDDPEDLSHSEILAQAKLNAAKRVNLT